MSSRATRTLYRTTARSLSTSSSTSPSRGFGRHRLFNTIAGLAAVLSALSASAIDPNRMVSEDLHDSWGSDKGLPSSSISAIAQTSDGYLWLGTDKGLIRFDGLSFRRFEQANPSSFPIGTVRALLTDDQNNLWVLLENTKLFRYQDGAFELS